MTRIGKKKYTKKEEINNNNENDFYNISLISNKKTQGTKKSENLFASHFLSLMSNHSKFENYEKKDLDEILSADNSSEFSVDDPKYFYSKRRCEENITNINNQNKLYFQVPQERNDDINFVQKQNEKENKASKNLLNIINDEDKSSINNQNSIKKKETKNFFVNNDSNYFQLKKNQKNSILSEYSSEGNERDLFVKNDGKLHLIYQILNGINSNEKQNSNKNLIFFQICDNNSIMKTNCNNNQTSNVNKINTTYFGMSNSTFNINENSRFNDDDLKYPIKDKKEDLILQRFLYYQYDEKYLLKKTNTFSTLNINNITHNLTNTLLSINNKNAFFQNSISNISNNINKPTDYLHSIISEEEIILNRENNIETKSLDNSFISNSSDSKYIRNSEKEINNPKNLNLNIVKNKLKPSIDIKRPRNAYDVEENNTIIKSFNLNLDKDIKMYYLNLSNSEVVSKDSISNTSFDNLSNPNIPVNKLQIFSKRKKFNDQEFPYNITHTKSENFINENHKKISFTNRNYSISKGKKEFDRINDNCKNNFQKCQMNNKINTNKQSTRTPIKNLNTIKTNKCGSIFQQLNKASSNLDNSFILNNNHEKINLNAKEKQAIWFENFEKMKKVKAKENSNLIRIGDRSNIRNQVYKKNYKDFNEIGNSFEDQILSNKNKKIVKIIKKKDYSSNSLHLSPQKNPKMEDSKKYNEKIKRTLSDNTSLIQINNFNNKIMMNNNIIIKDDSLIKYYKSQFFLDWKTNLKQDSFSFEIASQNFLNKDKNESKDEVLLNNQRKFGNNNKSNSVKFINSSLNQNSSIKENQKENLSSEKLNSKLDDKISTENSKDYNIQINIKSVDSKTKERKISEKIKINQSENSHLNQGISYCNGEASKKNAINEAQVLDNNSLDCKKVQKVNEKAFVYIIIDDNLYIRNCLKRILDIFFKNWKKKNPSEKLEFEIIEGVDGIDALKYVIDPNFSSRIKGIFIDENMEYLNGSEAIKIIRRLQNLNKISKLFQIATVTAFEDSITKSNILSAGVDEIYQKPIEKRHIEDFFKKFPIKKN